MAHENDKRILVSIPTGSHTQRRKLEGLLRYARERHGDNWHIQLDLGGFVRQKLKRLADWNCDGIVAYIDDPSTRHQFLSARLPTVLIEPFLSPDSKITSPANTVTFVNDHAREGRTAAEYFLSRQFKSFAYVGTPEETPWSALREQGYVARLREEGLSCTVYAPLPAKERDDFAREMPRLVKWLKNLPPQTAVFVAHDLRARQVLTAADTAKLAVPADIAVLGVDDDELICETASPALSSIPTQDYSLGYSCGRALDELFKGHDGKKVLRTAHTHVTSRASTDLNAVEDAFVAQALNWARKHLSDGASVESVARGINYSKRMLQTRARHTLGHSLGDEIRLIMLTTAAEQLATTDKSVSLIAHECGFTNVSHLSLRFKKHFKMTPLAYRKAMPVAH